MQVNLIDPLNNILKQNPQLFAILVKNFTLQVGANSVPTSLGQSLQGWQIIRQRAKASIYDAQDTNPAPATTLVLVSDAVVSVDLLVW